MRSAVRVGSDPPFGIYLFCIIKRRYSIRKASFVFRRYSMFARGLTTIFARVKSPRKLFLPTLIESFFSLERRWSIDRFPYRCLVHDDPYVAIRHGLYLHPFLKNFYFSRMPWIYFSNKFMVWFSKDVHSPIFWIDFFTWIVNFAGLNF